MKNYVLPAMLLFACSKNDSAGIKPALLGERWHLKEVLADPGDGSGIYQAVESGMYLTFFGDDTFKVTESLCNGAGLEGTFGDSRLYPLDCDYGLRYELIGDELYVYPPCIEPCGMKFEQED